MMGTSSSSQQVVSEQQTDDENLRQLILQQLENASFAHNNSNTMQITTSSFRLGGIVYQLQYNESLLLANSVTSFSEMNTMLCKETLATDDTYLGHLYNSEGRRATMLIWECEDADCCKLSCCTRAAVTLHMSIIVILAVAIFILLRYTAKFFCRIVWRQRRKTLNKEKADRLKYFGTHYIRSQQQYFNSISSLHQMPDVPAVMPIAVQAGESTPKPDRLRERLFSFLARSPRPESHTNLASSHRRPIYESNGTSYNQQASS